MLPTLLGSERLSHPSMQVLLVIYRSISSPTATAIHPTDGQRRALLPVFPVPVLPAASAPALAVDVPFSPTYAPIHMAAIGV